HTGNVAHLDVMRVERVRGVEEQLADLVGGTPPSVAGVEEPVHQELELEVSETVVVERALQVTETLRLQHVLEICMPDSEPAEADCSGRGAPVGPVEEAPFATDVHLHRTGDRPVQAEELDILAPAPRLPRRIRGSDDLGVRDGRDSRPNLGLDMPFDDGLRGAT